VAAHSSAHEPTSVVDRVGVWQASAVIDAARLRSQPSLAELDEHDLAKIARWIVEVRNAAGELLIEQGSMAYELFLIESGTVDVIRDGEPIAALGPGDVVGEMALMARQRRMASVRARTDVVALAMPADAFTEIAAEMPEFADELRSLMAARGTPGSSSAEADRS
jgi:CRP/FNR family transcriptional regulator, cyclic AMP receptor protein